MVGLVGGPWTRHELLAQVGRLDHVASVRLVEAATGPSAGPAAALHRGSLRVDVLVDRHSTSAAPRSAAAAGLVIAVRLIGPWLRGCRIGSFHGFPAAGVPAASTTPCSARRRRGRLRVPPAEQTYRLHGRWTAARAAAGYARPRRGTSACCATRATSPARPCSRAAGPAPRIKADVGGIAADHDTVADAGATGTRACCSTTATSASRWSTRRRAGLPGQPGACVSDACDRATGGCAPA